jgi:hypothetical protein
VLEEAEVVDDARADEDLEHREQLALLEQVGLAGLVDGVRDIEHGLVGRHGLDLVEHHQAEQHAEDAHPDAHEQQVALSRLETRQLEVQLARERDGRQQKGQQAGREAGRQERGASPQGGTRGASLHHRVLLMNWAMATGISRDPAVGRALLERDAARTAGGKHEPEVMPRLGAAGS